MTEQKSSTLAGKGRLWWRVLGSLLAVVVLGWSLFWVVGLLAQHTEELDRSVSAEGISGLRVTTDSGSVEVVGTKSRSISIQATFRSGLVDTTHSEARDGDTFVIDFSCPWLIGGGSCSADYRIEVPASLDVEVSASNSPVTLRGLDGNVRATTSNDRISVEDLSGKTYLSTSNGPINALGMAGKSTTLRSSNDRVRVEFVEAPELLDIRTSNDAVSVLLPDTPATFATDISTSNGDKSIEIRTDPRSPREIRVRTSNDDVSIGYQPN